MYACAEGAAARGCNVCTTCYYQCFGTTWCVVESAMSLVPITFRAGEVQRDWWCYSVEGAVMHVELRVLTRPISRMQSSVSLALLTSCRVYINWILGQVACVYHAMLQRKMHLRAQLSNIPINQKYSFLSVLAPLTHVRMVQAGCYACRHSPLMYFVRLCKQNDRPMSFNARERSKYVHQSSLQICMLGPLNVEILMKDWSFHVEKNGINTAHMYR